jgi:hypothetical protein
VNEIVNEEEEERKRKTGMLISRLQMMEGDESGRLLKRRHEDK